MMQTEKTVCFSGHRGLPEGKDLELLRKRAEEVVDTAIKERYTTFLVGGAVGWDMLCGELLIRKKTRFALPWKREKITVICIVPFTGQDSRYSAKDRGRYASLLRSCDDVVTLNPRYTDGCYKGRNQYMVDRSSRIITYYDGSFRSGTGQTVRMAERKGLEIINLY